MVFSVSSKTHNNKIKGSEEFKIKYIISQDETDIYCALIVNSDLKPIINDFKLNNNVNKYDWHINGGGYVNNKNLGYMHRLIALNEKIPNYDNENLTVDHINRIKLDNRIKNLRMASQSEQNSNRDSRSDKKPPCDELIEAGVLSLPKYVRWDKSEKKFVIDKHPYLVNEVKQNNRKNPEMSGTKSIKLTIIQKYQDILARLEEMNIKYSGDPELDAKRIQYKKEYEDICKCIQIYEGNDNTVNLESDNAVLGTSAAATSVKSDPIISKRNTAPGKKSVSKLIKDCGVKAEDIPKYCYYVAASEKRADKFVIDKHPKLIELGTRQWATTGSAKKTTLEKFNMMIEKYKELSI